MSKCHIFKISVVVPGESVEEAWNTFQQNPEKYIPEKTSDHIEVTGVNANMRAVAIFSEHREPSEKEKAYAHVHGWQLKEGSLGNLCFVKKDIRVIAWNHGWAPSHPATGVFDNASWHSAIHAMNVADQMFFGGNRDDILGWFGVGVSGIEPHPARPLPLD